MKLAPPSTYPAWGGGRGARRGGPAVEGLLKKCEFVAGGGAGAEGPLAGKLCSTDMPPLPHTDPFLPEGPAFLCLLPSPFSLHLESRATFPAFPCPPRVSPFLEIGACLVSTAPSPVIATPPPLLGSPVIPSGEPPGPVLLVSALTHGVVDTFLGGREVGLRQCDCHLFFSYPLSSTEQ